MSEHLERLRAMTAPKQQTWDLSPNDVAAIAWAVASVERMQAALQSAIRAGEYVVKLVEADCNAGRSLNPNERSMPAATLAHCYAAMAFLDEARKAVAP